MNCEKCGKEMVTTTIDGLCMECWAESYREKTPPAMYGWICPRCGAVHSPFDLRCDCPPPVRTWISSSTGEWSVLYGKTEGGEGCND